MTKATLTEPMLVYDPDDYLIKPCFRGTRVPISTVWDLCRSEGDARSIHKLFPKLTIEQIKWAIGLVEWR